MSAPILPDNILRRMDPADRLALGKAARTAAEVNERGETGAEKDLHRLISAELKRREIPFIHARMDKKSNLPEGWPDFTTFLHGGQVRLIEIKTETGRLEPHQADLIQKLQNNGYAVFVVRSFVEFLGVCGLA